MRRGAASRGVAHFAFESGNPIKRTFQLPWRASHVGSSLRANSRSLAKACSCIKACQPGSSFPPNWRHNSQQRRVLVDRKSAAIRLYLHFQTHIAASPTRGRPLNMDMGGMGEYIPANGCREPQDGAARCLTVNRRLAAAYRATCESRRERSPIKDRAGLRRYSHSRGLIDARAKEFE